MKLVLYSGGQNRSNHALHRAAVDLCGSKKRIRFTYIPFCSENSRTYYQRFIRRYSSFGVTDFHCLAVDEPFGPKNLARALSGDAIYLAGGNTYYFLHHLRESGMLPKLKRFARDGGVLMGLSAGALILSPNIGLAGVPRFDADENQVDLKDLSALGLVPFEFSPHYSVSKARDASLAAYSKKTPHPIFACADGGGIVVDGNKLEILGTTALFARGEKLLSLR